MGLLTGYMRSVSMDIQSSNSKWTHEEGLWVLEVILSVVFMQRGD